MSQRARVGHSTNNPILFNTNDGYYAAYKLTRDPFFGPPPPWIQRAVEFLFSQIFGASAVLATSAAVWYLLAGNGPACVASAVLSSVCSSYFWQRIR